MEYSLAIKGIANSKILQELQQAFLKSTGLEFSFVDFREKIIILPKYAGKVCKDILSSNDPAFLSALNKARENASKTNQISALDYNKVIFSLIPISIQDKATGGLLACFSGPESVAAVKRLKNLSELLSIMINYILKKEVDFMVFMDSDKQYSRNQESVIRAIDYIKKNYHNKDISLQRVASEVSLSHYYFSHIFKNEFKTTFIEYLTRIRMEAASKLLKNMKLNINQVAYAVGYQDPNYFSKVFKKCMKVSPVKYRNSLFKKGLKKQIITE